MTPEERAVWNEQVKLTGTALNNLSVAVVVTGIIVPVITLFYGTATPKSRYWVVFAVCWLVIGCGFHWLARLSMRRYKG